MDVLRSFSTLSLSPMAAVWLSLEAANNQIWVYDLERSTLTPQTLRWNNDTAIWTPDGSRLVFASNREGPSNPLLAACRRKWSRREADHEPGTGRPRCRGRPTARPSSSWKSRRGRSTSGSCNWMATKNPDRSCTGHSTCFRPRSPRTDAGSRTCRTNRVAERSTSGRFRARGAGGRSRSTAVANRYGREPAARSSTGMGIG